MANVILAQNSVSLLRFYTYIHTRADDGMVFYIGKGKCNRAYSERGRNNRWARTAKKHGWNAYICAYWYSETDAFEHEKSLILHYRELNHPLCNMTDGGEGASGISPSEETRKKLGDATRGKPRPPHVLAILRAANIGRKRTPEQNRINSEQRKGKKLHPDTVKKIVAANTGKKRSLEARTKMSVAAKKRGISTETLLKAHLATRGKKRSAEFCAKISAAVTGRPVSKETREKISAKHKGKEVPQEMRDRISKKLKGSKLPEATKAKIRAWSNDPVNKAKQSARFKGKPWSEARRLAQQNRQK